MKSFLCKNEIHTSSHRTSRIFINFPTFHLSLSGKAQRALTDDLIPREACNVAKCIRSWHGLPIYIIAQRTRNFNFSTHIYPLSRNNALSRAQQAIRAHSICISTPRYPLILLPHLNHYTFRSLCARHLPSVAALCRTNAPKSHRALVSSHLHSRIIKQSFHMDLN